MPPAYLGGALIAFLRLYRLPHPATDGTRGTASSCRLKVGCASVCHPQRLIPFAQRALQFRPQPLQLAAVTCKAPNISGQSVSPTIADIQLTQT